MYMDYIYIQTINAWLQTAILNKFALLNVYLLLHCLECWSSFYTVFIFRLICLMQTSG